MYFVRNNEETHFTFKNSGHKLEGENMQTQYGVLGYRVDFYFHDYKLAKEIDGNGHGLRNIDYEIKRHFAIEQELGCGFILTKNTLMFLKLSMKYLGNIKQLSNQLTKKTLIDKILMRFLGLEFKSDNTIK